MVKKKTNDQEETKHGTSGEKPDFDVDKKEIKDQTQSREEEEDNPGEIIEVKESVTTAPAPADKVVPPEPKPEEKLAEMQDKYLRLSAEFDNYRKRTLREKIELTKYASENIILDILPLMDDFERAIAHMPLTPEFASLKEGVELIYGKFSEFLKKNGVREVESLNCTFNVELHDAVAQAPVTEPDKKGKIVDVVQKGYYLQDKVIRHSKVVVGE